jgi:hypothetical protein
MFVRVKGYGPYRYLQIVENHREGKRTVQRALYTLGRVDKLMASGATDTLLRSLARFGQQVKLVDGYQTGRLEAGVMRQMGPELVFGRLWREMDIGEILDQLLKERRFEFPVERVTYLTVLHRLFESGSDRAAARWRRDVRIPGSEDVQLHHHYRAMRWLGEVKDGVEEALFARKRDLFTELSLAFFDTTSIYFEGQGGESLGHHGHSKDHRPDLRQIVVGAVLTGDGRPVCSEIWPGNHADGRALLPVVDRLRERFGIRRVCWVADRGDDQCGYDPGSGRAGAGVHLGGQDAPAEGGTGCSPGPGWSLPGGRGQSAGHGGLGGGKALYRLPQSSGGSQGRCVQRSYSEGTGGPAKRGGQATGRQPGIPAIPTGGEGELQH